MKIRKIFQKQPRKTPNDVVQKITPYFKKVNDHVLETYQKQPQFSDLHIESSLAGVDIVTSSSKETSSSIPKARYFNISTKKIEFVIDAKENKLIRFNQKPIFRAMDKAYKTVEKFMNEFNK